jgi:hypothetical protein
MVVLPAQEYSMIRSKECFKCKTVKPLEEFYKHTAMGDGHLNKCKECAKKDVSKHRLDNIERIRSYDKQRANLPHRKELQYHITKKWRNEDKRRVIAHNAVARAIKKGLLIGAPCVRCGNIKSLAHHEDYDKPLDVMWLCEPCHKQRHKELKEEF